MDAAVVEPVDVGERRPFDVLDIVPGSLVEDQLGLVEPVEALGQRIVVGVTAAADRVDARLAQALGVANERYCTPLSE